MLAVLDAGPSDVAAMAELFREMDEFYGETTAEPIETKVTQISAVLFADPPLAYALLAWDGTRLTGLAAYSFLWPATSTTKSLYLKELYVSTDYRKRGTGKALMDGILKIAADNDCSRVEWTTDKDNAQAQHFYEQLGFPSMPSKVFYRVEIRDTKRPDAAFAPEEPAMPGETSLARLIREYGQRWEFERVQRGTEWIAVSRGPVPHIVGARDLGGLSDQIKATEQEEQTEQRTDP